MHDLRPSAPGLGVRPPWWVALAGALVQRLPFGRYRALEWLSRRRPTRPFVMRAPPALGGFSWECDLRDTIAREVCFTGRYEPPMTVVARSLLPPGGTFVDVGANWGYFTLVAAHQLGPDGRVLALEPDPRLFRMLEDNVRRNGFRSVTVMPVAAHARTDTVRLVGFSETEGNFGLSHVATGEHSGPWFTVPARTLDDVLDELDLTTVDLMKIDIEGAEGFALQGLARSLAAGRVRRLLLELHPAALSALGQTTSDALRPLTAAGFRAWAIEHSPWAYRRARARRPEVSRLLERWDPARPLDAWPHLLWVLPGLEPLQ